MRANQSPIAAKVLAHIGELYAIERDAGTRQQLRQQKSTTEAGCVASLPYANPPYSGRRQRHGPRTIDYTLKRWPALIRYASSGVLPIGNNSIENAMRSS